MSETTAMVLIVLCKSLAASVAIVCAAYLAYHGKDGWGWMLFVAVCIAAGSVKFNNP